MKTEVQVFGTPLVHPVPRPVHPLYQKSIAFESKLASGTGVPYRWYRHGTARLFEKYIYIFLNTEYREYQGHGVITKKLRRQVIERAGGLCEVCRGPGDFRGLAIHHKVLRSRGGKDDLDNLILLCGRHHSEAHGIREVTNA